MTTRTNIFSQIASRIITNRKGQVVAYFDGEKVHMVHRYFRRYRSKALELFGCNYFVLSQVM